MTNFDPLVIPSSNNLMKLAVIENEAIYHQRIEHMAYDPSDEKLEDNN
jgi:hypothetical protein